MVGVAEQDENSQKPEKPANEANMFEQAIQKVQNIPNVAWAVANFPLETGAAQIRVPENMTEEDLQTLFDVYLDGWKKILLKKIKSRSPEA